MAHCRCNVKRRTGLLILVGGRYVISRYKTAVTKSTLLSPCAFIGASSNQSLSIPELSIPYTQSVRPTTFYWNNIYSMYSLFNTTWCQFNPSFLLYLTWCPSKNMLLQPITNCHFSSIRPHIFNFGQFDFTWGPFSTTRCNFLIFIISTLKRTLW